MVVDFKIDRDYVCTVVNNDTNTDKIDNKIKGKQTVENNVINLDRLFNKAIGNPLIRLFFDSKADEIVDMFSDGPATRSKQRMLIVLQKISPNNSNKWRKIN